MKYDLTNDERSETATAIRNFISNNEKSIENERIRSLERTLEKLEENGKE